PLRGSAQGQPRPRAFVQALDPRRGDDTHSRRRPRRTRPPPPGLKRRPRIWLAFVRGTLSKSWPSFTGNNSFSTSDRPFRDRGRAVASAQGGAVGVRPLSHLPDLWRDDRPYGRLVPDGARGRPELDAGGAVLALDLLVQLDGKPGHRAGLSVGAVGDQHDLPAAGAFDERRKAPQDLPPPVLALRGEVSGRHQHGPTWSSDRAQAVDPRLDGGAERRVPLGRLLREHGDVALGARLPVEPAGEPGS